MKKRAFIIALAAMLLCAGCDSSPAENNSPGARTSESAEDINSNESEAEGTPEADGTLVFAEGYDGWRPESDEGRWYENAPVLRESSQYMAEYSEDALSELEKAASLQTPFALGEAGPSFAAKMIKNADGAVEDIVYDVTIENVAFSAFLTLDESGNGTLVADPAYLYNIPLFTPDLAPLGEIKVNGRGMAMDTFEAKAVYVGGSEGKTLEELSAEGLTSGSCVYARVTANLRFSASEKDGLTVEAGLLRVETDGELSADKALEFGLDISAFEGKGEAGEVYAVLSDNAEMFLEGDVAGANLIDLDFDGTPELLVSHLNKVDLGSGKDPKYSWLRTDIYSISDGGLTYIDHIDTNVHQIFGGTASVVGLKPLENGEKAWFFTSRARRDNGEITRDMLVDENGVKIISPESLEADYLFTLKDGKLEFTELFRRELVKKEKVYWESVGEELYRYENDYDYYDHGTKMEPEVFYDYSPYYDPEYAEDEQPDWPYYVYKGETWAFDTTIIFGELRNRYCEDIEWTYRLYGQGFSELPEYLTALELIPMTERTVLYRLAYITDAFYFGEYSEDLDGFYYNFIGAYAKPVIYLYPEKETDISVELDFDGEITCAYPEYNGGWNVTARPDGTLTDARDGKEYYCLYWEGESEAEWDMSRGTVVRGTDTAAFLDEKLTEIGLNARERNEFIIYWLPIMEENEYNFITFQTETYENAVALNVDPAPDSVLRVFMVYAAVPRYFETEEQHFDGFERNGFTLVEWGGGEAVAE